MTLVQAEQYLRHDDKAIRLRRSLEGPNILVERKTFRGRYGAHSAQLGADWNPDSGARRELGHVLVATIHRDLFNLHELRASLQAADSWRQSTPHWKRVEDAEATKKAQAVRSRKDGLRYKASELFDRYSWKMKSRVPVTQQLS
jgi:hypothetical protein